MATTWTGKLYLVEKVDGRYSAHLVLPAGGHAGGTVKVFDVAGPKAPTDSRGRSFSDAATFHAWIKSLKETGFKFVASS
jgi:hypothetical protein